MNVLIITAAYPPEVAPAGMNAAELAEQLTLAGHRVTVLTGFPSHPTGRLFSGWKARRVLRETTTGGFELIRCIHSFVPRFGLAGKLWYYITFAVAVLHGSVQSHLMSRGSRHDLRGAAAVLLAKIREQSSTGSRRIRRVWSTLGFSPGCSVHHERDRHGRRRCDVVGTLTDDMRGILPLDFCSRVVIQRHWGTTDRPMPRAGSWQAKARPVCQ
jgi:hypothetical protein